MGVVEIVITNIRKNRIKRKDGGLGGSQLYGFSTLPKVKQDHRTRGLSDGGDD